MGSIFGNHSLIGRRFIAYTVLFSSCLALIFTLLQVQVGYQHELEKHKLNQELIKNSLLQSLAQSVWTFDDAQIYSLLQGMVNIPMIERVSLSLPDNVKYNVGQIQSSQIEELYFKVTYAEKVNKNIKLGNLTVYSSMDDTYLYILKYSALMLFLNLTKTGLVIGFMFFLIDRLIGRHLFKISRHLYHFKDSNQAMPLVLNRRNFVENDELELVVKALNNMQKNIEFERNRAQREAQRRESLQQQIIDQSEQVLTLERNVGLAEIAGTLADELKQPLRKIRDYSQLCGKMLQESVVVPGVLVNVIEKLNEQATVATDILARSQNVLINTQPTLQSIDINQVLSLVVKLVDYNLKDAQVMLIHHDQHNELWVMADQLQLEQVLINLIRNAIDALTEQPQGIRLIEITTWNEGETVYLKVEDNGAGFNVDSASELFKPFFTTKEQSIGIGLSISQNLIAAMKGTIKARNRLERGACFTVSLPQSSKLLSEPVSLKSNLLTSS
ncbi:MAG: GHKL domain-containing protein [Gammaproteobacteria bacterium]|nr:GHKL domain-containing protein [Gammaproteobacteria bacterium]